MQTNYNVLFSIQVFHSYFKNSTGSFLQVSPDSSTKTLLQAYGLVFRAGNSGFDMYANAHETGIDLLEQLYLSSGINSFNFDITTHDPMFHNYTELPLGFQGLLSYSSDDGSNQLENENTTLLHTRMVDAQNERKLGTLKIRFDDIKKQLNSNVQAHYTIRFAARSTLWQYYVVNQSDLNLEGMRIKSLAGIQFDGPVAVSVPNGQKAFLFTSKTFIPLSEYAMYKFDLITDAGLIISVLPTPGPANLSFTVVNGVKKACSPVYLYL